MSVPFDAGLIHRQDECVFSTAAAIKLHELFGATWQPGSKRPAEAGQATP
jgi:hypothetical protein